MKILLISITMITALVGLYALRKKKPVLNSHLASTRNDYPGALYPISIDRKWGYMNYTGEIVIQPRFTHAEDFYEGMAAVSQNVKIVNGEYTERYGFIDTTGQLIIDFRYNKVMAFSQGLAVVVKDDKYGFADKNGNEVIPCQYEEASPFSEGFATVKVGGRNGIINQKGEMVIAPRFARACWVSAFSEGLAPVYTDDDKGGYIDSAGNYKIDQRFTFITGFSESLALVLPEGSNQYGFINPAGEFVIPPQYEDGLPFSEGVATVRLQGSDGKRFFRIIDRTGKVLADKLRFQFVGIFKEGLAGFETEDFRWGFIDKTGKVVIEPVFASVRLFRNGLSKVESGSLFKGLKGGYIDKSGRPVQLK